MCVCIAIDRESGFDTRNRCTFRADHDCLRRDCQKGEEEGESEIAWCMTRFASSIFSSSWKDEDRKDRTRVINGRGGEDRFRIDDGRGNRGSKTLRSAHKYVNAIQEDNEPLKVVQRRLSGSCVPANLIAVVFTGV